MRCSSRIDTAAIDPLPPVAGGQVIQGEFGPGREDLNEVMGTHNFAPPEFPPLRSDAPQGTAIGNPTAEKLPVRLARLIWPVTTARLRLTRSATSQNEIPRTIAVRNRVKQPPQVKLVGRMPSDMEQQEADYFAGPSSV